MLHALPGKSELTLTQRLLAILALTALTAIAARITIPLEPVPFTFQVLAVLLAGMLLGARDGALSQLAYVGLIALNLPLDARALGAAALVGPTAGYLYGFIPMALATGWLVERHAQETWQRWLAGAAGVVVLYACGVAGLMLSTGMDLEAAWAAGVAPFLVFDLVKAALAASLLHAGRRLLLPD
ncbi:MAG: biotin transporter BioY [Anaerolineaceae bacterium]|nr:biotin transporter BioY [Anaerolineaceae bacterium]